MRKTVISVAILAYLFTALWACKKDKADSNPLTSKLWKRSAADKDTSLNPSDGQILYALPEACESDDTYHFVNNDSLVIAVGEQKCGSEKNRTVSYRIDNTSKTISISGIQYLLIGLTANQLKYAQKIPAVNGFYYIMYMYE